jgi:hypothetical protein
LVKSWSPTNRSPTLFALLAAFCCVVIESSFHPMRHI